MHIIALLTFSYFLGALPFGLWIAWKVKGLDIRTVGSGNIGSTNVGRICGRTAGTGVMILDVAKGYLPPVIGGAMGLPSHWLILSAMLAIIGHNFSIFLRFQGGKGIATSAGALLGISFPVGLLAAGLFCGEILLFRYVSVGSLLAAVALPFGMMHFYPGDRYRLAFSIAACIMAFYKHRANVVRLFKGTEPRVVFGRKSVEQSLDTADSATAVQGSIEDA
jgi:glycerol-3-phosphate acyltransferase PlsY